MQLLVPAQHQRLAGVHPIQHAPRSRALRSAAKWRVEGSSRSRGQSEGSAAVATRRGALLFIAAGCTATGFPSSSLAQEDRVRLNKEVDPNDSPYIQELLARSRANKDQYDKERLDAYNKKNFKEYFEFIEGNVERGGGSTYSDETKAAIKAWLENNKSD